MDADATGRVFCSEGDGLEAQSTQWAKPGIHRKRQPIEAAVAVSIANRTPKNYFAATAFSRTDRRDLYLAAVFLWIVPFCIALSIKETVSRKLVSAAWRSPAAIDSRSPRNAVRSLDLFVRFTSVRFSVWRARFSAEK